MPRVQYDYPSLPTVAPPPVLQLSPEFIFIFEHFFFFLWCFTIPVYFFLMYYLINAQLKNVRDLKTPFFKLCIVASIIDILCLLNNYFCGIFPKWGLFRGVYLFFGRFYANFYLYMAWSLGACQAVSVSVLATNRLSAILFPQSYQRAWYGRRLWGAIAIQVVPGFAIGIITLFNEAAIFENPNGGLVAKFLDKDMTMVFFMVGGVLLVANSVYLIAAYFYLFRVLRKRNREQHLRQESSSPRSSQFSSSTGGDGSRQVLRVSSEVKRREHRLFIMSSCIVGVQLSILGFFIFKLSNVVPLNIDQFYLFYNALCDIYASANPYLLLIFSDALRKHVLEKIGFRKNQSQTIQVTVTLIQ